jgi:hypothetical protein
MVTKEDSMQFHHLRQWLAALALMLVLTACDEADEDNHSGTLVGTWQLMGLQVDWVRDIAVPAETSLDTSYALTASWTHAEAIMGSEADQADRILAAFTVGDTLLDTTAAFNAAVLAILQIAMTATFNEDFSYIITGTYPTMRLVPDSCQTEMVIPQISDAGQYEMDYLTGVFGISPGEFDQVLPEFHDGQVLLSDDGETVTISYVDRTGHDQLVAEGETWDEADRVIHGAAELPVALVIQAFSEEGTLSRTGYIWDTAGQLSTWGDYLTYYALVVTGFINRLLDNGSASSFEEALAQIGQWADAGQVDQDTGISFATLLTDDSGHVFDPQDVAAGGKLLYKINPVCIPVNEIIDFQTTWFRID